MDLKQYAKQVREIAEELPDAFVYLTSKENKGKGWIGGSVAEVAREQAARFIADDSHRLSSPQEIAAYKERQEVQKQQARTSEATKLTNVLLGQLQALPSNPVAPAQPQQQAASTSASQEPAGAPVVDKSSGGKQQAK